MEFVRRAPGFGRLWAAAAVSLVGDWLSFVALGALTLDGGGGPFALAAVFAAHALPGALAAPLTGALVDRYDRRRVLVVAGALAAALTAAMAIAVAAGAPALATALLAARSAVTSTVPAAETAAVRRLVGKDALDRANAILAATWSAAYVVGMAAGGVAAAFGPVLALVLDAATFVIAAALHGSLPALPVEGRGGGLGAALAAAPGDTAAAVGVAWRRPRLLAALLGKTPAALAGGAGWLALNLLAARHHPFGPTALSFGVLQAVRGAGTGLGPIVAERLRLRGVARRHLQAAAMTILLVAIAGLAVARAPWALAILALAWGVGTGTNWVLSHAALQRHADDEVIGRLAAVDELLTSMAMVGAAFAGAAVAERVAAVAGLGVGLGGLGLVAVVALTSRPRSAAAPARSGR